MAAIKDHTIVPCVAWGAWVCSCHSEARAAAATLLRTYKTLDWNRTQKLIEKLQAHRQEMVPRIEALIRAGGEEA